MNPEYVAQLGMTPAQRALLVDASSLGEAVERLAAGDEHQAALALLARHMAKPYAIGCAAACL